MDQKVFQKRPTLGFLITDLFGQYQAELLKGIQRAAREQDFNLIVFQCRVDNSFRSYDYQYAVLYDFVKPDNLDALVIASPMYQNYYSDAELKVFCDRFSGIPMISIGAEIPGIPGIFIDNKSGIRETVDHLIQAHHCKKIAFIHGPKNNREAQERFEAYRDALENNGRDVDPALVIYGDFSTPSGDAAVEELLKTKGHHFDALVASNDNMALGAMNALKRAGISIPGQVRLTGFDDSELSRDADPRMTTVMQPFGELGKRAAEAVMNKVKGGEMPSRTILPSRPIHRASCGCEERLEFDPWYTGVSTKPEKLVLEQNMMNIRHLVRKMASTMDKAKLLPMVEDVMKDFGFESYYFVSYPGIINHKKQEKWSLPEQLELLAGYERIKQNEVKRVGPVQFASPSILPPGVLDEEKATSLVVSPLFIMDHHIGYLLTSITDMGHDLYDIVCTSVAMSYHASFYADCMTV